MGHGPIKYSRDITEIMDALVMRLYEDGLRWPDLYRELRSRMLQQGVSRFKTAKEFTDAIGVDHKFLKRFLPNFKAERLWIK